MIIIIIIIIIILIFIQVHKRHTCNFGPVKCNKGKDPTENKLYLKLLWVIPGC
jgi:hypothetical protein